MTKKTVEEVGKIFVEEFKHAIDNNLDVLISCVNAQLIDNKADTQRKYQVLLREVKDRLPKRGVTEEEFNDFLPHITDYQVDMIPYIVNKFNPNVKTKEDLDDK